MASAKVRLVLSRPRRIKGTAAMTAAPAARRCEYELTGWQACSQENIPSRAGIAPVLLRFTYKVSGNTGRTLVSRANICGMVV